MVFIYYLGCEGTGRKLKKDRKVENNLYQCTKCKWHVDLLFDSKVYYMKQFASFQWEGVYLFSNFGNKYYIST
jgi:hypothetical protein